MPPKPLPLALAVAAALVTAGAAAGAGTGAGPGTVRIGPTGVGAVKLGETYQRLHAAHLVGPVRAGCEFAGPQARSARLRSPLAGSVDLTSGPHRRVATITLTGGATAHGVGVGATRAAVRRAFPTAVFDHSTDTMFGITLVKIPRRTGWRVQFALDVKTRLVTLIGIPNIPFCD